MLVLAAVASSCGPVVAGPSPLAVAVVGRVLDYRSQAAIAGASVHFSSDAQLGDAVATTASDGTCEATVSAPGSFTISVGNAYVGTGLVPSASYRGDRRWRHVYLPLRRARGRAKQVPVVGAMVSLGDATATAPAVVGRGVSGVRRLDVYLEPA